MPTERLSMRRIRQVLQLHFGARANTLMIAGTVGVGRSTVQDYLARAAAAGLLWPLPLDLTDEAPGRFISRTSNDQSGSTYLLWLCPLVFVAVPVQHQRCSAPPFYRSCDLSRDRRMRTC
jgi:hypothetical protein